MAKLTHSVISIGDVGYIGDNVFLKVDKKFPLSQVCKSQAKSAPDDNLTWGDNFTRLAHVRHAHRQTHRPPPNFWTPTITIHSVNEND